MAAHEKKNIAKSAEHRALCRKAQRLTKTSDNATCDENLMNRLSCVELMLRYEFAESFPVK
jgi:hypothetical protein